MCGAGLADARRRCPAHRGRLFGLAAAVVLSLALGAPASALAHLRTGTIAVDYRASVTVPAKLTLSIRPHRAHWGGKIRISGQVLGGWVPPSGEVVVLKIGWKGGSTESGHLYTDASGRFSSTYTFLRGNGTEQYSIWAATAKETDYPFAPARSRRVAVTVSQR